MNKFVITILFFITTSFPAIAQNTLGGIGAQLFLDTAGGFTMPRIMSLMRNYPAYDLLKATDFIMKVNDVSCKNKTIEEVIGMIRGDTGTIVHITVADTKQGARPREYDLKRLALPAPPQTDPVVTFNTWCDEQAKQLKKKGFEILKTFTSECGNYFFNFNADAGGYRIYVYTMEPKSEKAGKLSFNATAKVYDSNNENGAVELLNMNPLVSGNEVIGLSAGTVTFNRDCVGVVSITLQDDVKKCKAMYVIVYR